MFFSLMNSPATFQTMMDDISKDLISKGVVVVYLDNILIFMETLEEHWKITRHVLELLEKHKLYLCSDKCKFEKTTIKYLRVIISHNSVAMDPVKIAGITEWPAPMNKKKVQSLFRFTNFYRRFIRDFSKHARLLFDLTRNNSGWRWGEAECATFARLKGSVTSALVLISPDPTKPVRGTPLCHAVPPRTLLLLPTCLPPSDAPSASDVSSASRCIFHFTTHLPPPDLSPTLPPTMVPSSACLLTASPGCLDFHCHPTTFCNVSPSPLSIPLASATPLRLPLYRCTFRPYQ